ncbi:MAG: hypothetical protein AB2A00_40895, partial [Myxococcota bacterium]
MGLRGVGLWVVLALASGPVLAESPRLQAARDALDNMEQDKALEELQAALKDESLSPQDRAAAHWLIAKAYFDLGKNKEIIKSVDATLAIYPLFEPDENNTAPELLKTYRDRAKKYRDAHKIRLAEPVVEGTKVSVPVTAGEKEVADARVLARPKGTQDYVATKLTLEGGKLSGELAPAEVMQRAQEAGGLEYTIQTLTKGGMPNATVATEEAPRLLELAAQTAQAPAQAKAEPATTT